MSDQDIRPRTAIGHVILRVGDIEKSTEFFKSLGLRCVVQRDGLAILELRGGTHLLLFRAKRKLSAKKIQNFDLMVDDLEGFRKSIAEDGVHASEVKADKLGGHLWFEVDDPDGRSLGVYSSHTEGRPV
jgi:catechol 2,3-dioxygenase-like lactoylglutathione lyase family enzyme